MYGVSLLGQTASISSAVPFQYTSQNLMEDHFKIMGKWMEVLLFQAQSNNIIMMSSL